MHESPPHPLTHTITTTNGPGGTGTQVAPIELRGSVRSYGVVTTAMLPQCVHRSTPPPGSESGCWSCSPSGSPAWRWECTTCLYDVLGAGTSPNLNAGQHRSRTSNTQITVLATAVGGVTALKEPVRCPP
jgi:hypothetical protein